MSKFYVLDTNVILSDPNAVYAFGDNVVVIPTVVLEELDSKKRFMDEIGRNARYFSNELDRLRKEGNISTGITLPNKGTLLVKSHRGSSIVDEAFPGDSKDNKIISVAYDLKEDNPDKQVILVSKDTLVRVKADFLQVCAEDYLNDKVKINEDRYTGVIYVESSAREIASMRGKVVPVSEDYFPNQFIVFENGTQREPFIHKNGSLYPLYNAESKDFVFGLVPKNLKQKMVMELLLDPEIPLVTITGKAGTGKTLLSLASALEQTLEVEGKYDRVLAARPIVPMGKDIGYLPGEKEDKVMPYMQPIYDNLEFLFNVKDKKQLEHKLSGYEQFIQIEVLTYIRGRSIPNQFIIIDEAQNLTKHEVKTIVTRVGEGSKVVLMGDPEQIDHPYLDAYSNGLTHLVESMKDQEVAGHIELDKGERSYLAQICADIL